MAHGLKRYRPLGRPGENMKNKIVSHKNKELRMTDNDTAVVQNEGVGTWFAPIQNPLPFAGLSRIDGPDGPIGDPPISLDASSVSEGTL